MQDNIPDALVAAFERKYDADWNNPQLRNERHAMRYGWAAAMEAKQCLHQIQEPAAAPLPDVVLNAILQAEAALEVAVARILKKDPGHPINVTSEGMALVAVRAALAATPAAKLIGPAFQFTGSSDAYGVAVIDCATAEDHVADAGKMVAATSAPACNTPAAEQAIEKAMGERGYPANPMNAARAGWEACLSYRAAPVVLPEPFALYDGDKWYANEEAAICSCANMQKLHKVYTEQQVRALLATGGQGLAVEQAPVLYVSKGQLDNHRYPEGPESSNAGRYLPCRITPAGKFTTPLYAAPQQADARDEWYCEDHPEHEMGHDGCKGAGVPESCRLGLQTHHLRFAKQDAREAEKMRDDMASHARRLASELSKQSEDARDAGRYRDLRSLLYGQDVVIDEATLIFKVTGECPTIEEFDAGVDSAIAAAKGE